MKALKKLLALPALAALAALTLLGCGSNNGAPDLTGVDSPDPVEIRVAHLSPDAPNVDVWVNGSVVLSNVPYEAVSDYLVVDPGTYRIQVTPAGASSPIVIDAELTLQSGVAYTVAATGLLADIAPIVLIDDRQGGSDVGVRFVHAGPDAPPVDITLADGTILFGNVAFREAEDYINVPAGTYDLQARVAGTDTVALDLPGTMLPAANLTIFAIGRLSDDSLTVLVAIDG